MTGLLDGELAGVHDPRGRADSALVRRALPGQTLVEAGPLSLACSAPSWAGDICAGVAGRVQYEDALREELRLGPEAPIEKVLAAGYARWGTRLLDRLHGPFALVVWSRDDQRGLLAQDQLGGRSLFTFIDGRRLLFATEVTVLLAMLPRRPDPDEIALVHHLVDHGVPDGRTLFRGLGRLGGGRHLELSDSGHVERRHWAPRYQPPLREPEADLAARLRQELVAVVGDAVATDRTGAMLLSGGLDSSVVAGVAAPRARGLKAISAAFPAEPELDETSWARRVADYTGMALTTVPIERRDPFRAAEDYLRAWQLPLPVPGLIIEEPLIATAHRLRAKVVFDGQGGDELFGATPYLVADRLLQLRPRSAWRLARRHPWLGSNPPLRHVWQVFVGGGLRGAVPPGLHTRVRRWREPGRYAPAWLRPAHRPAVPRHARSLAVEAARRAALVGVLGRHADTRARDGRHRRLPAPPRAHGRLGSPVAPARPAARRARPAHPTRDELRSGHIATARAGGAAGCAASGGACAQGQAGLRGHAA